MALVAAICSTISFFAMKTRLPPKPPGRFFAFEAFKEVEYQLLVGNFFVSLTIAGSPNRFADIPSSSGPLGISPSSYTSELMGKFLDSALTPHISCK